MGLYKDRDYFRINYVKKHLSTYNMLAGKFLIIGTILLFSTAGI